MTRTLMGAAALCAVASGASAQLFGVGNFGAFQTQSLYSIDVATGAATRIGDTGLVQIADIAYSPATGKMFALTVAADLYELNLTTGASTLVAARAGTTPEGGLTVRLGDDATLAVAGDVLGA